MDRSLLEAKAVAELKEIAKSLDLKVSGLKKAEIIDAIAGNGGGPARQSAGSNSGPVEPPKTEREAAPPMEEQRPTEQRSTNGSPSSEAHQTSDRKEPVRDEGAVDERRHDDQQRHRRPQNRSRVREKAEPRESGRGRRRRRGRGGGGGRDFAREERWDEVEVEDDPNAEVRTGILDLLPEGYGFLRTTGYLPGDKDVYVSVSQVRRFRLRKGDEITGSVRSPKDSEKYQALLKIRSINGGEPESIEGRPRFGDLTPLYPQDRLVLEHDDDPRAITARIIDLIAPIGKGQRGMIVSPPKAGKTTVMKEIANAIRTNNPECYLMVVLVDERPEEVTDMQRTVKGEVIYSTFDRPAEEHTQVSELAIERAKRLVEMGTDVVIVLDSITRLARAHNLATPASGRILSGGVDSQALSPPKRFYGAARNIEEGGSLTILGTALVETGSKMDEVIYEEFKGTGNMELHLDRKLADKRIYPAVNIEMSGTRKEELLFDRTELNQVWKLRRVLLALEPGAAIELLIDRLKTTKSNAEFLAEVAKSSG